MTVRIFRACLLAILCLGVAAPAFAFFSGNISAVTYLDEQNDRRIRVFAISDGHLVENRFNGTTWTWIDHGLPPSPGNETARSVATVSYVDNAGNRRIYVFVVTSNNRLVLRFFNGFIWQWADQGGPQVDMGGLYSAITYVDPTGNRRIYFFGSGYGGKLVINYWNGAAWKWADNGTPPGAGPTPLFNTNAITYVDAQGNRRIDVFCSGQTTHQLFSNSWNGSSWDWDNHGGTDIGEARAVTFTDESGDRRIHVFADKDQDTLRVHSWYGNGWVWVNLAKPPGNPNAGIFSLDAIAYTDIGGNRRMQVFADFEGMVFSRIWDGSTWQVWINHGMPAGSNDIHDPAALTYFESSIGVRHIHLFAHCADGEHLCDHFYNGANWQWLHFGAP
jgi:hypothetical protein